MTSSFAFTKKRASILHRFQFTSHGLHQFEFRDDSDLKMLKFGREPALLWTTCFPTNRFAFFWCEKKRNTTVPSFISSHWLWNGHRWLVGAICKAAELLDIPPRMSKSRWPLRDLFLLRELWLDLGLGGYPLLDTTFQCFSGWNILRVKQSFSRYGATFRDKIGSDCRGIEIGCHHNLWRYGMDIPSMSMSTFFFFKCLVRITFGDCCCPWGLREKASKSLTLLAPLRWK